MKKLTVLLFSISLSVLSFAQTSGGPDTYGYTWKNNNHAVNPPPVGWVDILSRGTQVTGLADDNYVGPFPIPNFQFYWYPTPQFWIGSNGFISFKPQNISSAFPASVPLADGRDDWIAPIMADMNFAGTGNPGRCYYYSNSDSLIVTFVDVPLWVNATPDFTGSNTFQIILTNIDTSITFNYLSMSMGTQTTLDVVVGIENSTGTIGLSSLIDIWPTSNTTTKFYYPPVVTYSVTDGGVLWSGNPGSHGIFVKSQGPNQTFSSNFRNYGNQLLSNLTVYDSIRDGSGLNVSDGSVAITSISALRDTTIDFTNTFSAPAAGTYTMNSRIDGITGDLVPSNDGRYMEMIAVDTSMALPGSPNPMTLDYSAGITGGGSWSWSGGTGGIAVYIEPPIYPVRVENTQFYITSDANSVGFHAMIFDDDGPNGAPGTLLDSVFVPTTSITLNAYTYVTPSKFVDIEEGGVYVLWQMNGNSINLAQSSTPPFSRRCFEYVLGAWSEFRNKETSEFVMGMNVRYAPPVASFEIDSTDEPNMVFSDSSKNSPVSWEWNFGDGSPISTVQHPTYAYSDTGSYNVCLKVTNAVGSDSTCKSIHIDNVLPVADFTFDASADPTVQFTDKSTGALISSWFWDFDDSGVDTLSAQNPSHTFGFNGNHNVCLTVVNHAGTNTACKFVTIIAAGVETVSHEVSVKVYPNPFNDKTRIDVQTDGKAVTALRVYDAVGKRMNVDYTIVENKIDLDGSNLAPGTYLFEVYGAAEKLANGRLMVK